MCLFPYPQNPLCLITCLHIILSVLILSVTTPRSAQAQAYTSYLTGDSSDVQTAVVPGICLMGGSTENDNAMRWWMQRSGLGDVLVLRCTGSNGYNSYLFSTLGLTVNSVETLVLPARNSAYDPYVLRRVREAEAIWIAGGDQANYVNYWKNTPLKQALQEAVVQRGVPIGGTSAGMAILGSHYFAALNGTALSADLLANPYHNTATVGSNDFLRMPYLNRTITDTHFDNPDRRGRLMAFMGRQAGDSSVRMRAIACDEYTAVCIDSGGLARVFGGFPQSDDNAYFAQGNCIPPWQPEMLRPSVALSWNRGEQAVKVYRVKGTQQGTNTFDLSGWRQGSGGEWVHWWVQSGLFSEGPGTSVSFCDSLSTGGIDRGDINQRLSPYPNPASDRLNMPGYQGNYGLRDVRGSLVSSGPWPGSLPVGQYPSGPYLLHTDDGRVNRVLLHTHR
ncbi:MAG: cyanophycinase [Sphingomonadales bacterium]|nr:cyanophycinase [Sphingomonadales bacterium]